MRLRDRVVRLLDSGVLLGLCRRKENSPKSLLKELKCVIIQGM